MNHKPLAPGIGVSTQLPPAGIAAARAAGYGAIINNRPDGEEPGQPDSAELEAEARAAGLDYHHIPVVPGQFGDAQVDAFCAAMGGCEKPVLAFCKSGMRATSLWALSQAGKLTTDEILHQAAACGYDLTPLVPRIEARARAARQG
ncbi:TIGR01244 family sulfur transferase [Sphingomonas canadensis]|uniref:TIGR01244 family sulfur transferase n=1 Tax=Sphingomonas canadensis TaxID=1219257 RepID=A0ABW3HBZ8_9SPHN|nr:TIGR01244 family sulfur transferase [Sphingomonas canadensis]MCW3837427.1 TIGR01244 family sulfur transferase [Sphingomonas canadensis]